MQVLGTLASIEAPLRITISLPVWCKTDTAQFSQPLPLVLGEGADALRFSTAPKKRQRKEGALRLPCTKLGTVLCAAVFGNDSAVRCESDTKALFSSVPWGALLFSALEKRRGGRIVS